MKSGNYLSSSGNSAAVFELNPAGRIVKTFGGTKNHTELDLTFNSGWQKLLNGNMIATYWHGPGYKGNGPQLVEYNSDNQVVWTWSHPGVKQVTNLLVLN